jgi:hypothetical protein
VRGEGDNRTQPVAFTPFRLGGENGGVELKESDLKSYPHFDRPISIRQAMALANDPARVAANSFYPFIRYINRWRRFADKGEERKSKERPIRYAARVDAYIFSRYRHLLSEKFEHLLRFHNIDKNVIAYRRIRDEFGRGKCNIHFAHDAAVKIHGLGNCCAIALDISSFFESLDHARLKDMWCRLLGVTRLPDDPFSVFNAITRYSIVDKQTLYERLGYYGYTGKAISGIPIKGYLTDFEDMPTQLCTGKIFRKLIAGGDGNRKIIHTNYRTYGIPQGAPISDLLANIYLFDFDCQVARWADALGGFYFRYSDDILIVVPGGKAEGLKLMHDVSTLIRTFGSKLVIKKEKSSVVTFSMAPNGTRTFNRVYGKQGRNGLEYLGFRFDGQHVYLRDSTLSNLYRKITRTARYEANSLARRYPNKDFDELNSVFDYEALIQKFGRVRDFEEKDKDYKNWTFWTYVRRATSVLGTLGLPIHRQLSGHREIIREKAKRELARAIRWREERKLASISVKPHAEQIELIA